jgi:uncharacterized protein (DUF1499 family)
MAMKILVWSLGVLAALAVLLVLAGRFGLLSGTPPDDLGVRGGMLKAPSLTPNSVSSQARLHADHSRRDEAQIAPLPLAGDAEATLARVRRIAESLPGAKVVRSDADYLYVQFTTRLLGFVDDTEFWFDRSANVIQVRSASRVGRRDFDVNRARIEAIRTRLAAPA